MENGLWIILDKNNEHYPQFSRRNKDESISEFEKFSMKPWKDSEARGFRCVEINISSLLNDKHININN